MEDERFRFPVSTIAVSQCLTGRVFSSSVQLPEHPALSAKLEQEQ